MKGNIDYYGDDRLAYVLLNCGGHAKATVARADERVATYGMQGMPRVRTDFATFGREIAAQFGHYGYGYIVIDPDGILRGANASQRDLPRLLDSMFGDGDEGDEAEDAGAPRTHGTVENVVSGRPGLFNLSKHLTRKMTADVIVNLRLPAGFHVYGSGAANPEPTKVTVRYASGVEVGEAVLEGAVGPIGGVQHVPGPVRIRLPIEIAEGTPIGNYFVHGTVRFMACNDDGCLPAMEQRWRVTIRAL